MTAHERAHARLDVVPSNEQDEVILQDTNANEIVAAPTQEEFLERKWIYSNGFIHLEANPDLVLGVTQCKLNQKVKLCIFS